MVDLEEEIPAELYAVVAEVLGWVYRLRERKLRGLISFMTTTPKAGC